MNPSLSDRHLARRLTVFAVVLTLICFATQSFGMLTGRWGLWGAMDFFNLDFERSLPTWFSTMLWFLAFVAARSVAKEAVVFKRRWSFLSWLLLAISIDEVAGFHEAISYRLHTHFNTEGYLTFAFVVPGAVLAAIVGFSYLSMLLKLPRRTGRGIFFSGVLFVLAAIALESLAANWSFQHPGRMSGRSGWGYFLFTDAEELLEMLSAILMLKTLSEHAAAEEKASR
jgi:hypothetical protein